MIAIHTLKPNVNQAAAIEAFRGGGVAGLLGRFRFGALRSVADVHVPFFLYQVHIRNDGQCKTCWLAFDAVSGALDPYEFDRIPDSSELAPVETRNRLEPVLAEESARQLLAEKIQRLVFQTGFFRIRSLQIRPQLVPLELHVPYWIGFYGAGECVRVRVLDAVRSRFEGGKARAFFETWLASSDKSCGLVEQEDSPAGG